MKVPVELRLRAVTSQWQNHTVLFNFIDSSIGVDNFLNKVFIQRLLTFSFYHNNSFLTSFFILGGWSISQLSYMVYLSIDVGRRSHYTNVLLSVSLVSWSSCRYCRLYSVVFSLWIGRDLEVLFCGQRPCKHVLLPVSLQPQFHNVKGSLVS